MYYIEQENLPESGSLALSLAVRRIEGQLELVLKCDTLGHISVGGVARNEVGIGNKLLFKVGIDQSQL